MGVDFAVAGLGLQYGTVRLVRALGGDRRRLMEDVRSALPDVVTEVAHVGSTAVPGLLAKPVIDLALALAPDVAVDDVARPLARLGWLYRGDAGRDGGWVFVLEDAPWHRVAHAHGVEHSEDQWSRYLQFRDLLRASAAARRTYEATKRRLADQHPDGRRDYTTGKAATVQRLLSGGV